MPTIFTEKAEGQQFRDIASFNNVVAEKSIGGTADINYKINFSRGLAFIINQYLLPSQPLALVPKSKLNLILMYEK